MPTKQALFYSLLVNAIFLALCLFFGDLRYGAIDDYFMAGILTGIHGTDNNVHLTFVNALYGYMLLPLYYLFPKIGWYYIGELFSVYISLSIICFVLFKKMNSQWGLILSVLFVSILSADFYMAAQFTQCGSILSAAGMLLFVYAIAEYDSEKRNTIFVLLTGAIFLLWWGSWLRWHSFLMGMPFFALALLLQLKKYWNHKWLVMTSLAVVFCGAFAMQKWDRSLYETPEYKTYMDFQSPRATLGDGNDYNQQAVYEDLEELGYSGNDFALLRSWTFYDNHVFSLDSLKPILASIRSHKYKTEMGQLPLELLRVLIHSACYPIFIVWLVLCLGIFCSNRTKWMYPWCSLLLVLLLLGKLILMHRLVYRVENGFWLYASVLAIPFLGRLPRIPSALSKVFAGIVFVVTLCSHSVNGVEVRHPATGNKGKLASLQDSSIADYQKLFAYIDSMPDSTVFLASMNAYMRFAYYKNPPYLAEPTGSWRRIIPMGYWTPYLPDVEAAFRERGLTNPMKDAVLDNVYVIDENGLVDYLQRHYYKHVVVDTVRNFNEMVVYKYSLGENE